jgi:hypothetical protein
LPFAEHQGNIVIPPGIFGLGSPLFVQGSVNLQQVQIVIDASNGATISASGCITATNSSVTVDVSNQVYDGMLACVLD